MPGYRTPRQPQHPWCSQLSPLLLQQGSDPNASNKHDVTDTSDTEADGGYVDRALGLGSAAADAVGDSFNLNFRKGPASSAAAASESLSPDMGYPQEFGIKDAATGGTAGPLDPEAADKAETAVAQVWPRMGLGQT